jgi:hypothetical protein
VYADVKKIRGSSDAPSWLHKLLHQIYKNEEYGIVIIIITVNIIIPMVWLDNAQHMHVLHRYFPAITIVLLIL